jgi:hypothetical protein
MLRLKKHKQLKNVVLVHGAFADGSGYNALYDILSKKGYNVTVVQNPLSSLEDDVKVTVAALDRQDGPAIFGRALLWRVSYNTGR